MTKLKGNVNPLTLQPGGATIALVFSDGKYQMQRAVKYPNKYIETIVKNGADLIEVYDITDSTNKELIWKRPK